jgi:hypothetical protein
MSSDFAADLDAALSARLQALRAAAEEAKERIDHEVDTAARRTSRADGVPREALDFGTSPASAAAVSFDLDEDFGTPLDAEGIPLPEENSE